MSRQREAIEAARTRKEGNFHFVRLRHPIRKKIVCFNLGQDDEVMSNLSALNRIWTDEAQWLNPQIDNAKIRKAWCGPDNVVKLIGGRKVVQGKTKLPANAGEVARLTAELTLKDTEIERLNGIIESQAAELEHWRGKKTRKGPYPTLEDARTKWLERYTGKDADHKKEVEWNTMRFVKKFGPTVKIDTLSGKEIEIRSWLDGLKRIVQQRIDGKIQRVESDIPVSAGRRSAIRMYVLKMLRESGIELDSKLIKAPTTTEIRKDRGQIRFLTRDDAEKLAKHLPPYWAAAFRIQVAIGLRPSELPTLHRDNFGVKFETVTLAPLAHLSLKTGPRRIPVPEFIRPIVEERLRLNAVLFPQAANKSARKKLRRVARPWEHEKTFSRKLKKALVVAATAAGVTARIDARIGRRTCASLLLASNVGADRIAALLGNSAKQIIDSYGDPDVNSLPLGNTTVLKENKTVTL